MFTTLTKNIYLSTIFNNKGQRPSKRALSNFNYSFLEADTTFEINAPHAERKVATAEFSLPSKG